jgi:hypothetical protein
MRITVKNLTTIGGSFPLNRKQVPIVTGNHGEGNTCKDTPVGATCDIFLKRLKLREQNFPRDLCIKT